MASYTPSYRRDISGDFKNPGSLNSSSSGGFGRAASMTDMSATFNEFREQAPNYDGIVGDGMVFRSQERRAMDTARSTIHQQGIAAKAEVEAAEIRAKYAEEAADTRAGAAGQGAFMSGAGKVLGAALPLLISSDRNCKENITPIANALETLRALKPVSYNYKEEFSSNFERRHNGFIAQDYKEVLPDATYYDESMDLLCIDTGDLISLLVRGIQQLESRVARLEAQNALAGVK